MKPGGGRNKGSAFERKVAALVVEAFKDCGITSKDAYRTPLSGGHIHASKTDPGDLVISPRLRKLFPFHCECKAHATVNLAQFLVPVKAWKKSWKCNVWLAQMVAAAEKQEDEWLIPLLVFKENNGETMAAFPVGIGMGFGAEVFPQRLQFVYRNTDWIIVRFSKFLRKLGLVHDSPSFVLRSSNRRREA
jgi:hypothetical protein